MKKIFMSNSLAVLLILLVLFVAGCGADLPDLNRTARSDDEIADEMADKCWLAVY